MVWTGAKGIVLHTGGKAEHGNRQWVDDGAQYKKYMKENNKISAAEGDQEIAKVKKEKEVAETKSRKEAVRKAWSQLEQKTK